MTQHRLQHYFVSSRAPIIPAGRSFLDLPQRVRNLVYEYAGLDDLYVDLNYSNLKVYAPGTYPETRDCSKLIEPGKYDLKKLDVAEADEIWEVNNETRVHRSYDTSFWGRAYGLHQSMLVVSKQVHREVEAITYANAIFWVCLGQPLGFTRLLRMSDHALSNLRMLTVRLDKPKTASWVSSEISPMPPRYIDTSVQWGKNILKAWALLLERLSRSSRPGQLRLRVIFCAKTMDDARAIIEPMSRLPLLKDCGICAEVLRQSCWWIPEPVRFNTAKLRNKLTNSKRKDCLRPSWVHYGERYKKPRSTNEDTQIALLVQQMTQKLTVISNPDRVPFRYLDLPQEIRFAILEYTDLVSPDAVQWRPRERIKPPVVCEYCESHGYRIENDDGEYICFCHLYALSSIECIASHTCCRYCRSEDRSNICYCSYRGPIWSSACRCYLPRHTLFCVSSQVRQDAIATYYACNEILVTPYNSPVIRRMNPNDVEWPVKAICWQPRIELSLYLSYIAPSALQHIRRLEWLLPSSDQTYLRPRTRAWFDYIDTILLMEHAMNLPALTFTINLAASGLFRRTYVGMPSNKAAWSWYEDVVLPVRRLGEAGLRDFFVYLRRQGVTDARREHHERDLERAVMGKEYDSAKRGKPAERMYALMTAQMDPRYREHLDGYNSDF
jgi:hypothetical protein